MGLRIIDRDPNRRARLERDLTDAEREAELRSEVQGWIVARGGPGETESAPGAVAAIPDEATFMRRFEVARGRIKVLRRTDDVVAMASRIQGALRTRSSHGAELHVPVDIATLLELL